MLRSFVSKSQGTRLLWVTGSIGACRSALQTLIAPHSAQRSEKLVVEISLDHTVELGLWDPPLRSVLCMFFPGFWQVLALHMLALTRYLVLS